MTLDWLHDSQISLWYILLLTNMWANTSRLFSLSLYTNPFLFMSTRSSGSYHSSFFTFSKQTHTSPLRICQKGSAYLIKSVCFPVGSCIHYLTVSEASARVNMINTLPECSHLRGLALEDHRNKLKAIFTVRIAMFSIHYDNMRDVQYIIVNRLRYFIGVYFRCRCCCSRSCDVI